MSRKQRKLPLVFGRYELPAGKNGNRLVVEEGTDHRERVWAYCKRGMSAFKTNLQKRGLRKGDVLNAD